MLKRLSAVLVAALLPASLASQALTLDSLRAELTQVVEVVRLPAAEDSAWVALVTLRSPDQLLLTRFNRDNRFFLTYLLENTLSFDHRALLARAPGDANPSEDFYRLLGQDSAFVHALAEAVNAYAGPDTHPRRGAELPSYTVPQLALFSSRFFRADSSAADRPTLTVCAKTWQLLNTPFEASPIIQAWLYSIVRTGLDDGMLPETMRQILSTLTHGSIADSAALASLRRAIWHGVATSPEFLLYVSTALADRQAYLPFGVRP